MDHLNKLPRWFLVMSTGALMTIVVLLGGWSIRQVFADVGTIRSTAETAESIAVSAKATGEANSKSIDQINVNVEKIQDSQEQFRREYREDQQNLNRKLEEIARAVR